MAREKRISGWKKGFVYTLCILFLAGVLLELVAYQAEWTGRRRADLQSPTDIQVLGSRLDELTWLSRQAMGINASLSRNITNLTLNISDNGFPLVNSTLGAIQITSLKGWLENNWTNVTRANLSFNVTNVNDSGADPVYNNALLQTTDGINYSHTNFYSDRDIANLTMPGNFSPVGLTLDLACSRPPNATLITYTNWASGGGGLSSTINYIDPSFVVPYQTTATFFPGNSNAFVVNYTDVNGLWLQTIHADWVAPNYSLLIWDEGNTSYAPAYNKQSINCSFNISLTLNYSNQSSESLYIPVNTSLHYGNASYAGWLTIARD